MDVEFDSKMFGRRVNQCRKEAKLSQEKLAEMIGVSQQHLSNIINDHAGFSPTTLLRIATALDADVNYLIGANTSAGREAADVQIDKLFASLSVSEKQMCLALCQAYLDNRPAESCEEKEAT